MKERLRQIAIDAGCAGFGVTDSGEFAGVADAIEHRNETGFSGRIRFTFKSPELAADVRRSFPWAESLVVISWSYVPEAGSPGSASAGTGRIARFATVDHYNGLRRAAGAIATELQERGHRGEVLIDDDRLVDRAAAVRAGIAWWGKSTMVLDPKHGPWLLLGSIATDARLPTDDAMRRDCGSCDACIPACPTGAIVGPGMLDARRCLAHWLQTAGVFPVELRAPLGDRVYGCDDCLDACPPGFKRLGLISDTQGRVDLLDLLSATDTELLGRYGHFYIPRRRPRILRRNAILALGNTYADCGSRDDGDDCSHALVVLADLLAGPDEQLRLHSAWAIGRIGGSEAIRLLAEAQGAERVPAVRSELAAALAAATGATQE
ncbi:MAG: 4Fe-4S double cluster binding domain-containing protein [Acidimicrobiia bacterium]|nr:4Fe-4S double cluster binding domain-containing protein [Acidimicrobiia bacterium]